MALMVTEFWLSHTFNSMEFEFTFEEKFPGGEAEHIPVVPDAKPGYALYHLHVPTERQHELEFFLAQYAREHGGRTLWKPADSYPFNPRA